MPDGKDTQGKQRGNAYLRPARNKPRRLPPRSMISRRHEILQQGVRLKITTEKDIFYFPADPSCSSKKKRIASQRRRMINGRRTRGTSRARSVNPNTIQRDGTDIFPARTRLGQIQERSRKRIHPGCSGSAQHDRTGSGREFQVRRSRDSGTDR